MAQVTANAADALMQWATGRPIGVVVPSYAEFAGFFLAAASFLALPYALRTGAHIRVTSVLDRLGARARLAAEVWCSAAGAILSAYFTWYSVLLVFESLRYGDVSPGMLPVPLWIPQAAMSVGLVILTIAFVDRGVSRHVAVAGRQADAERAPPAEPGADEGGRGLKAQVGSERGCDEAPDPRRIGDQPRGDTVHDLAQLPIYILPAALSPLYRRLLGPQERP